MADVVGMGAVFDRLERVLDSDILPVVVASIVGRVFVWLGCVGFLFAWRHPFLAGRTLVLGDRLVWFPQGFCEWWLPGRELMMRLPELKESLGGHGRSPYGRRGQTGVDSGAHWRCSVGPCGSTRPRFCGFVGRTDLAVCGSVLVWRWRIGRHRSR